MDIKTAKNKKKVATVIFVGAGVRRGKRIMTLEKGVEASGPEKGILCMLQDECPPLPFPLKELKMGNGMTEQVYDIPAARRAEVLEKCYPFTPVPRLTEVRLDIHENKTFRVGKFMVIRSRNRNLVVSPYYRMSGGMAIDWMPIGEEA